MDGILEIKGKTHLMRIRVIKYQIVYPLKCLLAEADWILLEEKELSEKDFLSYLLKKTISATADFDRFREEGCYIDSYVEDDSKLYLDISLDLENLTMEVFAMKKVEHSVSRKSTCRCKIFLIYCLYIYSTIYTRLCIYSIDYI